MCMPEGRGFHAVCYTCRAEQYSASYTEASGFFNEHADEGHEVELVNLDNHGPLTFDE
jgi:hypothetical protein